MQNHRYHVHIICVAHEQPFVLDALAVFFQSRAFLTYDVSPRLPQASLYGRQCIDSCDHTVVVIGDNYGTTQNLGVSQMHLSYLSARAKLKPMLVLIKNQSEDANISRQLSDFTTLVENQAEDIYYYDDTTNIDQLLTAAYDDIAGKHNLVAGWMKVDDCVKENSSPSKNTKPKNRHVLEPDISAYKPLKTSKNKNVISQDSETEAMTDSMTHSIQLSESFPIKYSAQAYEGGNLTDIVMTMELTWQQVLQALVRIPAAFSSYGLQGSLNRLIAAQAEQDIRQKMPNVHAVSRCQIAQDDLIKLQNLLIAANWIQLTALGVKSSQELWKLTFHAKKLFKEIQQ